MYLLAKYPTPIIRSKVRIIGMIVVIFISTNYVGLDNKPNDKVKVILRSTPNG